MRRRKRELISPPLARMRLAVDEREWAQLEPRLTPYRLPSGTLLVDYSEIMSLARPTGRRRA
jgi:hypothetical protein